MRARHGGSVGFSIFHTGHLLSLGESEGSLSLLRPFDLGQHAIPKCAVPPTAELHTVNATVRSRQLCDGAKPPLVHIGRAALFTVRPATSVARHLWT